MNRGVPPTEAKERTGEFTPPGIDCWARWNRRSLSVMARAGADDDGTGER
jgi:hypothetical protein